MKLIKHKLIDGFKVFVGVENPAIDGKAAIEAANVLIAGIPEKIEFDSKIKEGKRNAGKAVKYKRSFMAAYDNIVQQMKAEQADVVIVREKVLARMAAPDLKKLLEDEKLYNSYLAANDIVENDLKEIGDRLKVKEKKIRRANTVYCDYEGNPEKMMVEDIVAEGLLVIQAGKSENQVIDIDGTIIDDFRGKEFHYKDAEMTDDKWTKGKIESLGDRLEFGKFTEDLSESEKSEIHAQNETERIAGLSADDKASELIVMVKNAMAQSVQMKSELEIVGDNDALMKSQVFYQGEIERFEVVYG